jgi:hypothetical protein
MTNNIYKSEILTITEYWSNHQDPEIFKNILHPRIYANILATTEHLLRIYKDNLINNFNEISLELTKLENTTNPLLIKESKKNSADSLTENIRKDFEDLFLSISHMSFSLGCEASNKNLETMTMKTLERRINDIDSKHFKILLDYLILEVLSAIYDLFQFALPIMKNNKALDEQYFKDSKHGKIIFALIEIFIYENYAFGIMAERIYSGKTKLNYKKI